MPEDMPGRMPEEMPDRMPEDMSDRTPDRMSERMPEDMPKHMAEDMPSRMPEDMPGDMPEDMPNRMPEGMPDKMPEDMSDRMPEDLPVTKRIHVMVGITRSKVIFKYCFCLVFPFTCLAFSDGPASLNALGMGQSCRGHESIWHRENGGEGCDLFAHDGRATGAEGAVQGSFFEGNEVLPHQRGCGERLLQSCFHIRQQWIRSMGEPFDKWC